MVPDFPASSPYVLGVGGTQFAPTSRQPGGDVIGEEVGVQTGAQFSENPPKGWITTGSSGGGFSEAFKRPSYQEEAVAAYLNSSVHFPRSHYWSGGTGRGIPDVSALAGLPGEPDVITSYYIKKGGKWVGIDGTSASAPAVAGMIARINSARLSAGKSTLGWIHPFLYQAATNNSKAFNDVVSGDNKFTYPDGFYAGKGWDAVTGLGTLNVGVLTEMALKLP